MIYLNQKELDNLHVGDKEIQRVLLGERLIWENMKVVSLGVGKVFDISSIYRDYANLTADNFFITALNGNPSVSGSITGNESGPRMGINTGLVKAYDSSTGTLSLYYYANGESVSSATANVTAIMIPNLTKAMEKGKVVSLGTNYQFNIKVLYPNEYMNFTIDNFAISSMLRAETGNRYYGGSFSCAGYGSLTFVYDSSTGILTAVNNLVVTNDGGGYLSSQGRSVTAYLIRR